MQGVFQKGQAADVENPKDLFQIFHCNVLEITRQVAGISLTPSPSVEISNAAVLYLSAFGGYQMELYLYTDKETMTRIAQNMKREPAAKSETLLYAAEFFNILGGHIVSRINRAYGRTARFKPPVCLDERCRCCGSGSERAMSLSYRWTGGNVRIEGKFADGALWM